MADKALRFGVNYTPLRHWYYCWNDWDAKAVADDFAAMSSLGIDHVRVQLIWPWFQPNPAWVSPAHLKRLAELMQIADDYGCDVLLCLLTGFLSGHFFLPGRVTGQAVFLDQNVFESERLFAEAVLDCVGNHPRFMGLDLGNEINCLAHDLPPAEGDRWARELLAHIRAKHPGCLVVNGVDHGPWMMGTSFSPAHMANDYSTICVHAWPQFCQCITADAGLDALPSTELSAFFTQWVRLFEDDAGRLPVWIQEFGCCDLWGSLEQRRIYLERGMRRAWEAGAQMFTFWCSHDKPRGASFHEYEYHYGLFDIRNRPKPLAGLYREMITELRSARTVSPVYDATLSIPHDFTPSDPPIPLGEWDRRTRENDFWHYYRRYLEMLKDGGRVKLERGAE